MRIAYVVRHIDSAGGRERVLTNKANYLVRQYGYNVSIVTLQQVTNRTVFALDDRIHVRHLKLGDAASFKGGRVRYQLHVRRAREATLMEISPDISVSMWWSGEFKVFPFLRDGSRKVLELHLTRYAGRHVERGRAAAMRERIHGAVTRGLDRSSRATTGLWSSQRRRGARGGSGTSL